MKPATDWFRGRKRKMEIKQGRHVAFTNYEGTYTGFRVGKALKITKRHVTVKLANNVKKRIATQKIYGVVWFKKIRPLEV